VKRFDVVALVTGVCFLGLALTVLANALVGLALSRRS
jgi:hypothetical protein